MKIPQVIYPADGKAQRKAKEQDAKSRQGMRFKWDEVKKVKDVEFLVGIEVLKAQKKTTVKLRFDPKL